MYTGGSVKPHTDVSMSTKIPPPGPPLVCHAVAPGVVFPEQPLGLACSGRTACQPMRQLRVLASAGVTVPARSVTITRKPVGVACNTDVVPIARQWCVVPSNVGK